LTAVAGYRAPDPAPADNTVTLTATTPVPPPPPPPPAPVIPVIAPGTIKPIIPVHAKKVAVSFPVTRSDTGAALTDGGTVTASSSVGGKGIANISTLVNGVARVTLALPKTAKGKMLRVSVTVLTADGSASKVATFRVR
jgi:hypothetical protein